MKTAKKKVAKNETACPSNSERSEFTTDIERLPKTNDENMATINSL